MIPGAQHRPPGKGKRNKNLFKLREFEVHQEHCGMKVGTDALLLAGYSFTDKYSTPELYESVWEAVPFKAAEVKAKMEHYYGTAEALGKVKNILEIGCGSGVISLLLAQQFPEATIHCVDIDTGAVSQTLLNIGALDQEHWRHRMRVYHTPIQEFDPSVSRPCRLCEEGSSPPAESPRAQRENCGSSGDDETAETTLSSDEEENGVGMEEKLEEMEEKAEAADRTLEVPSPPAFDCIGEEEFNTLEKCTSFDLILCSPPYFPTDQKKDRFVAAMDTQRRLARHTHTLTMAELVGVVEQFLTPVTGRFNVICSVIEPAKEIRDILMASAALKLEEEIEVSDCPGSKVIRMMYRSIRLDDEDMCSAQDDPKKRSLTIYARSHKEDPQVHRTYSHQYRHMLYKFCSHIPDDEEPLRVRIVEPDAGDGLLRSPAASSPSGGRWAQAGRSNNIAPVSRRLSVQRIANLVSKEIEHPQMTGFVLKKKLRRKISSWNHRLFVLRDGILKVYLSEQDQGAVPPRRAFHMRDVILRPMEEGGCEHVHSFYLDVASVDCFYIIATETKEELNKWYDVLMRAQLAAREHLEEELVAMALRENSS